MKTFTVETRGRTELVSITRQAQEAVRALGTPEGAALIFVPHTTAGVTINEDADPDVALDLAQALERALPALAGFRHAEGNSDAHVRASVVGASVLVPIVEGQLALGAWQGIFLCEFDGPRRRQVCVQALGAAAR